MAAMPTVLGQPLTAATAAVTARGFGDVSYLDACFSSPDIGDVVRQSPAGGTQLALTAPVQLYVQAAGCAAVPSVIGMSLSSASATLRQAGFTRIPYFYGCYGSRNFSAVVSQLPGPGASSSTTQPVSLKLQAVSC